MPDAMPATTEAVAETTAGAVVIGGGPAGLMAAEALLDAGHVVDLYDAMPSLGRKFLLAGKGGLNLTHGEDLSRFRTRYAGRAREVSAWLDAFSPDAMRAWAKGLGIDTFVGSSGRVFPGEMKAAPLLRAWLHRLRAEGLRIHVRHRWLGWDDAGRLRFECPDGERLVSARATVLALGGASWPHMGSDGRWQAWLREAGVDVAPLVPANCGFEVAWSTHLRERFAGAPIKPVALAFEGETRQGEFVLSDYGVEGSLIYAFSARLRDRIAAAGSATFVLDLLPALDAERVRRELARPRGTRSWSSHLKGRLGIDGAKSALLHELLPRAAWSDPERIAAALKALPITVTAARPIEEAISSAGGVRLEGLDDDLMLRHRPGVFCCGEMLDWEAPTGGYLLQATMASGRVAGLGAAEHLAAMVP
jgi:uncharacterized flavoprotein (TIGR03862 family)